MPTAEWSSAATGWHDVLARVPHDVYHLPAYAAAHAESPQDDVRAFTYVDGDRAFLLPLVLQQVPGTPDGAVEATSPYGYPGPVASDVDERFWSDALSALLDALRDEGAVSLFVRVHPLLPSAPAALRRAGVLVRHGQTVSVDLDRDLADVFRSFRSNHRRQIERSRRHGVTVTVDDWDRLPAFIDAYHETMRRVGAAPGYFFPPSYFDRLRAALPGQVHLLSAVDDDELVAGGLFFSCGELVQYHLGATRADALQHQPMKLVLAETCRWAQAHGARLLHLGGGVGGSDSDSLFAFKAGFSDRRHPYDTLRAVLRPEAYRLLVAGAGPGAEDDLTGFFPAFRRPPQPRGADGRQVAGRSPAVPSNSGAET